MKTKYELSDFNLFGVQDYFRFKNNHSGSADRYSKQEHKFNVRENDLQDHAAVILEDIKKLNIRCNTALQIKHTVNNYFINQIQQFLLRYNLPKSWLSGVYYAHYDDLNQKMQKVAYIVYLALN